MTAAANPAEVVDAVVVGTGFGGAVAACRLAQARLSVRVLERGKRYPRGGFPRFDGLRNWLWDHDGGLFDIQPLNEVVLVAGAAYGGGSQIYANVHLRMPPDAFAAGWPAGWERGALDPYYDLVAHMLDLTTIDAAPKGPPPKTDWMARAAAETDRREQFFRPPLAVTLIDPAETRTNRFGVEQPGCSYCGECDIGCNTGAKNTLDRNYLAEAERRGARVGTECEVDAVAALDDGRYRVTYHHRGRTHHVEAGTVILAAGAVGTTRLLLRCRDHLGALPRLSDALGARYSANGDFLAFAHDTGHDFDAATGPTITGAILHQERPDSPWFLFEEGGFPRPVAGLIEALDTDDDWFRCDGDPPTVRGELAERMSERLAETIAQDDDAVDTGVFLLMGRDSADGTLHLRPDGRVWVEWPLRENLALYDAQRRFCDEVVAALNPGEGSVVVNPMWRFLRLPVSVHSLGGAVMADRREDGVVDRHGEVFGHPGLYVLDGAALPSSTGVNPSHTIAAVAERNIETAIGRHRPGWQAPERASAPVFTDPLPAIPDGGTPPLRTTARSIGARTDVHARGAVHAVEAATTAALGAGSLAVELRLRLVATSLRDVAVGTVHPLAALGHVDVPALGASDARVGKGTVHVVHDGFLWALPFAGGGGEPYLLEGSSPLPGGGAGVLRAALRRRSAEGGRGALLAVGVLEMDVLAAVWHARLFGLGEDLLSRVVGGSP